MVHVCSANVSAPLPTPPTPIPPVSVVGARAAPHGDREKTDTKKMMPEFGSTIMPLS